MMRAWREDQGRKAREEQVRNVNSTVQDLDRGGSYGIKHNCTI